MIVREIGLRHRRQVRRDHFYIHEGRVRVRPGQGLLFGFKEFIDHERIAFAGVSAALSRGPSSTHGTARIDSGERCSVRQNNATSIRNFLRIDRAMADMQFHSGSGAVLPRVAIRAAPPAGPINSDAGEKRIIAVVTVGRADGRKQ